MTCAVVLASLALGSAAAASGQEDDESPPTVTMQKIAFSPPTLSVPAGATVVWVNGNLIHTVTADDGSFDSGFLYNGETFSVDFPTPGIYAYYCVPHGTPGGIGMAGTIVVEPST
jgi:plastocyanin